MPIDNGISEDELAAISKEVAKVLEKRIVYVIISWFYDSVHKTVEEYGGDTYSVEFDTEKNLQNRKVNGGR